MIQDNAMEDKKTTLEVIGPSVEDAIESGLDQLGLPRDAVDVEVLDQGQSGFLGIGNRQVRVRLTLINHEAEEEKAAPVQEKVAQTDFEDPDDLDDLEIAKRKAKDIVEHLLESMRIQAGVAARILEPEDDRDHPMVLIEVTGKDLSILIGRRAETLNSLQYITSLVLNQQVGHWVPLMIDVQGYRFRRERQLRQLARRLADQVIQTGRKQVLEPMPANERRLIHLELRYHPFVTTESVGEEPNRRTTIILKPKE
ncbi:spoIIIJ-associated protein [Pelolinea submarina]|jgi:spoIIIJ-associated protein|uniref:RNA-binding protein KhpB n=2 Tax=Pelolinea submarina TaxID=913107 RepID=A0A347ZS98_9CHLR|nr:spoIIIJ-associated protein [Pelolinea submarina]BBB48179.1 spoIIIJ-associated protein [Pelolinea submarina]